MKKTTVLCFIMVLMMTVAAGCGQSGEPSAEESAAGGTTVQESSSAGNKAVYPVYCICYDLFAGYGAGGKFDCITMKKMNDEGYVRKPRLEPTCDEKKYVIDAMKVEDLQ